MNKTTTATKFNVNDKKIKSPRVSELMRFIRRFKKNKRGVIGFLMVLFFVVVAILAPWIAPYSPFDQDAGSAMNSPSLEHIFGQDRYGRDILSRIIYGARISLIIGFFGVVISVIFGAGLGTLTGYIGGKFDTIIMRLIDILMAFPGFLLALAIISALGPGLVNVVIAIGVFSIPAFTRVARSTVSSVKNNEYVEAAHAMGASHISIIFKHIIPNSMAPIMVLATMRIATALLTAAGLSFLGLGAQPPTPEWGAMLSEGRDFLQSAPHISTIPGLAIMFVVLGFNMFGDGLRDAMDPNMKL